jgi:hypothetical protein
MEVGKNPNWGCSAKGKKKSIQLKQVPQNGEKLGYKPHIFQRRIYPKREIILCPRAYITTANV